MFKKSIMLPVLAVIAGAAASAFTTVNSSSKSQGNETSYYWFDASTNTYSDMNTVSGEESITGCGSLPNTECEKAYTQDQLVNESDPTQGVKNGETPARQIYQQP